MSIKDEKYSTRQRKFCCDTAVQGTNRNELERRHLLASKAEEIRPPLEAIPVHTVIDTANLCRTFPDIPEKTCCKVLERMVKSGSLVRLTKGLYYRPKKTRFGTVPMSEDEIIRYYTENNIGVVVGYAMYNRYGLTTQVGKNVRILSNAVREEKKKIGTVSIEKAGVKIDDATRVILEVLDVLQNYSAIEDLNRSMLASFLAEFCRRHSDSAAVCVLDERKYKKRTIAFMKAVLDDQGVRNSLGKYLSNLSKYQIPEMDEIFAAASAQGKHQ